MAKTTEQMNIVIVGHVDHGKSTLIGRLLADTNSLPSGKLEQIKATCEANSKPFEYAFLLDALKDEQSQGITIDIARVFFNTKKRNYIILDAPGHIEFLKNMVTGAARAEAAILMIDAHEGVKENSRRHGYLLSMLGIRQVVVAINKMDLVEYNKTIFDRVKKEYSVFLETIGVQPIAFVPVSAFHGEGVTKFSESMSWFNGDTVLTHIDSFKKEESNHLKPYRMPVQDIYKFTETNDTRRIIAGTIETGTIAIGDEVIFYPSKKISKVATIESFNTEKKEVASSGEAIGLTLETQIYTKPGELMAKVGEPLPHISYELHVNLFWLGKKPMLLDKRYKIKCGAAGIPVYLKKIHRILDASDLSTHEKKQQIERHDVAECVLQTTKPLSFDLSADIATTGRFVIVDDYEISGGGIISKTVSESKSRIEDYIQRREFAWEKGAIKPKARSEKLKQNPKLIIITGPVGVGKQALAKSMEEQLFKQGKHVYYLGLSNMLLSLGSDRFHTIHDRDAHIRQLGEVSHLFTDAGLIVITTISDLDDQEATILKLLSHPNELIVISMGEKALTEFPVDFELEESLSLDRQVGRVLNVLKEKSILLDDYSI
jgi:bifunctional enzyme CysN/CysC